MSEQKYNHKIEQLTEREKLLIKSLFSDTITKQQVESFTVGLNIEREYNSYILLLSYLGFHCDWKFFPKEIVPAIKAVNSYYQAENILGIKPLIEKIRILNRANIPVMLLKGLALKYYYAKGYTRIMSDFDVAVPQDKYDETIKLLSDKKAVYQGRAASYHGEIKIGRKKIEVHRWIFKNNGEKDTDIWERSYRIDFYGTSVYIMNPQDMFIHLLDNRSRDIFEGILVNRKSNWLFDIRNIYNFIKNFDIQEIYSRAKEFSVLYSVMHLLPIFAECFPELVDKKKIEEVFSYSDKYYLWLRRNLRFRSLMIKYRTKYTQGAMLLPTRVKDAIILNSTHYGIWRLEKDLGPFNLSLFRYCKECLNVDSVTDFWKKYIARISFN